MITYKWTVAKDQDDKELIPEGSDYCFDCNRGQLTHRKDSARDKPRFFGDVVGDYTVQLVATDNNGLASDPVTCEVHGYAAQALHIEMLWDNPVTDLDLHLVHCVRQDRGQLSHLLRRGDGVVLAGEQQAWLPDFGDAIRPARLGGRLELLERDTHLRR